MNIAGLSELIKQSISGGPAPHFPIDMPKKPRPQNTIQPDVPIPSFRNTGNGGYEVINQPPGTSSFAPWAPGMGVLKNPHRELPRFDPTGVYNDNNLPRNNRPFLLMPMAQPNYQPLPLLQQIGGY